MKSRLALVAMKETYVGPWAWVDGMDKVIFDVRGLGSGDGVRVEYDEPTKAGIQCGQIALGPGANRVFMRGWRRYRVCKKSGESPEPTTVELFPEV